MTICNDRSTDVHMPFRHETAEAYEKAKNTNKYYKYGNRFD
jgi:hypothetical protein